MNLNFSFLLDVALILALMSYIGRLIYLRSKRESVMRKYKRGTASYDALSRELSNRRLAITVVVTVLVIAKTIFDVRAIVRSYGDSAPEQLLFIVVLCSFLYALILYVVYNMVRGADEKQQDKGE